MATRKTGKEPFLLAAFTLSTYWCKLWQVPVKNEYFYHGMCPIISVPFLPGPQCCLTYLKYLNIRKCLMFSQLRGISTAKRWKPNVKTKHIHELYRGRNSKPNPHLGCLCFDYSSLIQIKMIQHTSLQRY